MNLEAFCYLGLLRFPEQLEPSLTLLPNGMKEEATKFLATVKDLPKAELIQRWARLREQEWDALRGKALERTGLQLDQLAPSLRLWCGSWVINHG